MPENLMDLGSVPKLWGGPARKISSLKNFLVDKPASWYIMGF